MTDRYTKTVLTIIAFALVWLCATDAARVAYAQGGNYAFSTTNPLQVEIVVTNRK